MDYLVLGSPETAELKDLLLRTKALLEIIESRLAKENRPLTLAEASKYLKVSLRQLYVYRERGEITVTQYGDKVWVMRSELDDFLKRHTFDVGLEQSYS